MRLHRIIVALTCACAMALALTCFVGCAEKSDEQVIRDALTSELDGYKNHDAKAVAWFAEDMDLEELAAFDVNAEDLARTYLDGFDYRIDDVVIEEDVAYATVTITCKSYSSYLSILAEEKSSLLERSATSKESASARAKAAGEVIISALERTELATCPALVIRYDRVDNTWKPAETALHDINMTMLSN